MASVRIFLRALGPDGWLGCGLYALAALLVMLAGAPAVSSIAGGLVVAAGTAAGRALDGSRLAFPAATRMLVGGIGAALLHTLIVAVC